MSISLTQSVYPSFNNNIIQFNEVSDLLNNKYITVQNSEQTYIANVKATAYLNKIQFNTKQLVQNSKSDFNFNTQTIVAATNSIEQYVFVKTEQSGVSSTSSIHNGVLFLNTSKDKSLVYTNSYSNNVLNKSDVIKTTNTYPMSLSFMCSTNSYVNAVEYNINGTIYTIVNNNNLPVKVTSTFSTTNDAFNYSLTASVWNNNYKNLRLDIL